MSEQWMAEIDGEQFEVTPIIRMRYEGRKVLLEQMLVTPKQPAGEDGVVPQRKTFWAQVPTVGTPIEDSALVGLNGRPMIKPN
jgi:hypothetical protein